MFNDIQITSDYMSRWVVLKRRVGAVTSPSFRLFKPVLSEPLHENNRGIDAINITNILNRKGTLKGLLIGKGF
jgi:hypothetical protein